jgi:hypothetical protein
MLDFTKIEEIIAPIQTEVSAFKTVLESCSRQDESFLPMCVFYTNKDTKALVVAPPGTSDLIQKFTSIAETMHLYRAISADSVIVALTSTMVHDETSYSALTVSVFSNELAWNMVFPYSEENNIVTWIDDLAYINEVDQENVDETGRDIFSMFYAFTHMESSGLNAEEILSYLAYKGAAIHQVNTNIRYISPELED